MKRVALSLLTAAWLLAGAPGAPAAGGAQGHVTGELPAWDAADPGAPAVGPANLLASERFWPAQVALREPWRPPGASRLLGVELPGVLIRVEEPLLARVDFGRDGLHEIPVERTDLVERADRIRRGELVKQAPNFLLAIGPRLLDAGAPAPAALPYEEAARHALFLCVVADPGALDFPALAAALAPLRGREGLLTILFPHGRYLDAAVRERLRTLGWPVAYLYDHLAEAYARTLVDADVPRPALLLVTDEGRLLLERSWRPGVAEEVAAELARAVEAALGTRAADAR